METPAPSLCRMSKNMPYGFLKVVGTHLEALWMVLGAVWGSIYDICRDFTAHYSGQNRGSMVVGVG